jgi:hypothetical protein
MTKLTKEVTRVTNTLHRGREIIVSIRPPDMLEFRLKGTQHRYPLSIVGAFNQAMRIEALTLMKKQQLERKARRAARRGGMK